MNEARQDLAKAVSECVAMLWSLPKSGDTADVPTVAKLWFAVMASEGVLPQELRSACVEAAKREEWFPSPAKLLGKILKNRNENRPIMIGELVKKGKNGHPDTIRIVPRKSPCQK